MAAAGDAEKPSVVFAFASSSSSENIVTAKEYNEWATTNHGQVLLDDYWKKSGNNLYIFFHDYKATGDEKMRGIARVCGPLSDSLKLARWEGGAYGPHWKIEWLTKESFVSKPFTDLHLLDMDTIHPNIAIPILQQMVPRDGAVRALTNAAATATAAQNRQRTITSCFPAS